MLHVEIKVGTDVTTAEICRLYWAQPERPTRKRPFLYSVEELGTRFGFSRIAVGRTVEQWCYAYDPARRCTRCGHSLRLYNRGDFELYRYGERECMDCTAPRAESFNTSVQESLRAGLAARPNDSVLQGWLKATEKHGERMSERDRRRHR